MSDPGFIEETIFIGARQLARPEEQAAYLDNACGDDRALRDRVERMLRAEQNANRFLANDPLQLDQTAVFSDGGSEAVGSMIGPYKLLQQIGEGGCGIVFMAEQEQPIRRRVALKVIKPGMDTRQVIARFEAERQALAMMDHPHIARVLDAGTTGNGRPYFIMELVRGIRITDYCDQNHLSTGERLDLFIKVVQAVQHAHQKGIIHRDLKPSNVLVTLHDGVPVPKVIDFGIAKALEQKLTDKTLFTQFEQFIGTPAYTSPEQAEMSGLDIDTRSDIYSLGVLLYELLVGQTPFDARDLLQSGLDEMRRIIREKEPVRPSTRLGTMVQGEVTTTAQRRRVSAPELIHLLKGDLDWIVMKCLEKDRTRRYDTATGLAEDIQHYLGNEPVSARPPSRVYRFGKLVRRNKLAFAAGVVVTFALVLGIVVSTWQAARAHRAEQVAKDEKDSAEAVLKFFSDKVLAAGRPEGQNEGLGINVTVRQAIYSAESQIAEAFQDRPLVEAEIRHTLGFTYIILGEPHLAAPQFERALALRQKRLGSDHTNTLSSMIELGKTYIFSGKSEQAVPLLEEALRLCRAKPGADQQLQTLYCMGRLGQAYQSVGMLDQALALTEETLMLDRELRGLEDSLTHSSMHNLAGLYWKKGRREEALSLMEETVKLMRIGSQSDPLNAVLGMNRLATFHLEAGKLYQSRLILEEALQLCQSKLSHDHFETIFSMSTLAEVYGLTGNYDQALPLLEEALNRQQARNRNTLLNTANLGRLLSDWAWTERTNAMVEMTQLTSSRSRPSATDMSTVDRSLVPSTATAPYERARDAEKLLRECLDTHLRGTNATHWRVGDVRSRLGGALVSVAVTDLTLGATAREAKLAEAETLLLEGHQRLQESKSVGKRYKRDALERLVRLYEAWGKPDQRSQWQQQLEAFGQAKGQSPAAEERANP